MPRLVFRHPEWLRGTGFEGRMFRRKVNDDGVVRSRVTINVDFLPHTDDAAKFERAVERGQLIIEAKGEREFYHNAAQLAGQREEDSEAPFRDA